MNMQPIVFKVSADSEFSVSTPVTSPIGEVVSTTRTALTQAPSGQGVSIGIWECTPGVWRRQVAKREFSYFISGHCFFTPDGQAPIELRAGDSVYFPANCMGAWDVRENVRKSYLILD
jgi:uncharacterized cupin superfamily protein